MAFESQTDRVLPPLLVRERGGCPGAADRDGSSRVQRFDDPWRLGQHLAIDSSPAQIHAGLKRLLVDDRLRVAATGAVARIASGQPDQTCQSTQVSLPLSQTRNTCRPQRDADIRPRDSDRIVIWRPPQR
jgi:hypothetical protein